VSGVTALGFRARKPGKVFRLRIVVRQTHLLNISSLILFKLIWRT
jgi:hypothetical protein